MIAKRDTLLSRQSIQSKSFIELEITTLTGFPTFSLLIGKNVLLSVVYCR
jgi:hypothetical protein